jgi:hypothetical protein
MYISKLILENFRKYKTLNVDFNPNLNVLVGENNSGKTAIIDAIRILLGTQSNDYYRVQREDFYYDGKSYADKFKITCYIEGISDKEGGNFLECISFKKDENGNNVAYLKIEMEANFKNNKIYNDVYIGDFTDNNGYRIPGEIKELLKVAFLKPLRDAENQMVAKKGSRLSQILLSIDHEILNDNEDNKLKNIISDANTKIKNATNEIKMKKIGDSKEVAIIDIINQFINKANPEKEGIEANFQIKDDSLREILEKLSVEFNNPNEGLGIENLLYIAIEFLLLKNSSYSGLKTVLIEEIEAHLHPQTQINLINFIIKNYSQGESGQIIMSTHSPNITSKVDIEKIILCKNNSVYSLKSSDTRLEKGDYKFLARFLDVTKSNLFFSKKIIFVEGDAENILIPTIAKIILGDTLESKGISVINVGSTAFLRYSRIFQRKDEKDIDVKIAIITDLDVKKNENETEKMFNEREETERVRKTQYYTYKENIKVFISPKRTLEYCIAMSDLLRDDLVYSMFLAKKEINSNANPDGKEKVKEALEEKNEFLKVNADSEDIASEIYDKNIIKSGNSISKAIIAQILANELEKKQEIDENFKIMLEADNSIKYIIDAIKFLGE